MTSPHVFIDSDANEIHRHRGLQLWRQVDNQRRRSGASIFQQQRVVDGVTIVARATASPAGNRVHIYGGAVGTILLFSDGRVVIDPFYDYSGGYTCDTYAPASPYAKTGGLNTGLSSFFPYNVYPIPEYSDGLLNSISIVQNSFPGVPAWGLTVEIQRDGSNLDTQYLLWSSNTLFFGNGWVGDWDITSRPYATSAIDTWLGGGFYGYVVMGVVGNFMLGGRLCTLFYEQSAGVRYWYLLKFSLEDGTLVEDTLLSTNVDATYNSPMQKQQMYFFFGNTEVAGDEIIYILRRKLGDILVIDLTTGFPVETIHSLAGLGVTAFEMRDMCVTANYVYVLTRESNGVDFDMVIRRAPRFTTVAPVWTTILSVTTDGIWHYANNSIYTFAVKADDSEMTTAWREGDTPFATLQHCYWKTYNISGLPDTPATLTFSTDSLNDPTQNIIDLKYK